MTELIFHSKNKMINIRPKKEILIFPSSGKSNPTQGKFSNGSLESDSSTESLQRPLDLSTFNFPNPTYTFIHPQDPISNSNSENATMFLSQRIYQRMILLIFTILDFRLIPQAWLLLNLVAVKLLATPSLKRKILIITS